MAYARGIPVRGHVLLASTVRVVLPDAAEFIEQRARPLAWHAGAAIRILARVAGRADVNEQLVVSTERERLRRVAALRRELDDRFGLRGRDQRVAVQLEACNARVGANIQIPVAPQDARSVQARAKALLLLEPAIAVGITQRDHRTGWTPSSRRIMT